MAGKRERLDEEASPPPLLVAEAGAGEGEDETAVAARGSPFVCARRRVHRLPLVVEAG